MKTRFRSGQDRSSFDSTMTPMIDVVFLLLIFFLTTASFQKLEKLLPSAISAESQSQAAGKTDEIPKPTDSDLSDCVIKIALEDDRILYRLNDEDIEELESLLGRMKAILRVRPDIPLVIDPSDDVPAGDAIRIYDLARGVGALAVYLVGR
ncbi:MAG: ExbD/TolR family protein [Planctomycetota bacterium]|jgi:biopolymer transport protein ExbD